MKSKRPEIIYSSRAVTVLQGDLKPIVTTPDCSFQTMTLRTYIDRRNGFMKASLQFLLNGLSITSGRVVVDKYTIALELASVSHSHAVLVYPQHSKDVFNQINIWGHFIRFFYTFTISPSSPFQFSSVLAPDLQITVPPARPGPGTAVETAHSALWRLARGIWCAGSTQLCGDGSFHFLRM